MWRGPSLIVQRPPRRPPSAARPGATAAALADAALEASAGLREVVDYAGDGLLEDLVARGFGHRCAEHAAAAAREEAPARLPSAANGVWATAPRARRRAAAPVLRILSIGCGDGGVDIPLLEALARSQRRRGSALRGVRFFFRGVDPHAHRLGRISEWVEREHPLWTLSREGMGGGGGEDEDEGGDEDGDSGSVDSDASSEHTVEEAGEGAAGDGDGDDGAYGGEVAQALGPNASSSQLLLHMPFAASSGSGSAAASAWARVNGARNVTATLRRGAGARGALGLGPGLGVSRGRHRPGNATLSVAQALAQIPRLRNVESFSNASAASAVVVRLRNVESFSNASAASAVVERNGDGHPDTPGAHTVAPAGPGLARIATSADLRARLGIMPAAPPAQAAPASCAAASAGAGAVVLARQSLSSLLRKVRRQAQQDGPTSLRASKWLFRECGADASDDAEDDGGNARAADTGAKDNGDATGEGEGDDPHYDLVLLQHCLYGCVRPRAAEAKAAAGTQATAGEADAGADADEDLDESERAASLSPPPALVEALATLRLLLRPHGRGLLLVLHRDGAPLAAVRRLAAPRLGTHAGAQANVEAAEEAAAMAAAAFARGHCAALGLGAGLGGAGCGPGAARQAAAEAKLARAAAQQAVRRARAEAGVALKAAAARSRLPHVTAAHVEAALARLCGAARVESRGLGAHVDTTRICRAAALALAQAQTLALGLAQSLAPQKPSPQRAAAAALALLRPLDVRLLSYLTGAALEEADAPGGVSLSATIAMTTGWQSRRSLPPLELLLAVDVASVKLPREIGSAGWGARRQRSVDELRRDVDDGAGSGENGGAGSEGEPQASAEAARVVRRRSAVQLGDRLFLVRSGDGGDAAECAPAVTCAWSSSECKMH